MNLTHTEYIIFLQKCTISIQILINEKSRGCAQWPKEPRLEEEEEQEEQLYIKVT